MYSYYGSVVILTLTYLHEMFYECHEHSFDMLDVSKVNIK